MKRHATALLVSGALMFGVATIFPCQNFHDQRPLVTDPPIQALSRQGTQDNLGDVEPRGMQGRIVKDQVR